jgi:hypothetical protein
MRIPLPNKLIDRIQAWWMPYGDWLNTPLYRKARRIDLLLVLVGIICALWYWTVGGWQLALMGVLLYLMFLMIGLWLL